MEQKYYYLLVYNLFFISAVLFSLLINGLFLKFSRNLGVRNIVDETVIRWGALSKPAFGGISFYIVFLLSIASYSFFFDLSPAVLQKQFVSILLAVTMAFLMGLADDAYNTKPFLKFFVQVMCGVILIISGIYIQISSIEILNYILTIFWVVGMMNSINMLDNMDAISASVSLVIFITNIQIILFNQDFTNLHFFIMTGVVAAIIGFLYFNWHPSRLYMGDTGSQFLGVLLAAMGIMYIWNDPYSELTPSPGRQFGLVCLAYMVPLVDTTFVVIKRLADGRSPFVGGKDHTTHTLALAGLSDQKVGLVFIGINLISLVLVGFIDRYVEQWQTGYTIAIAAYFLIVLLTFRYIHSKTAKGTIAA